MEAYIHLIFAYRMQGNDNVAVVCAEEALRLDPTSAADFIFTAVDLAEQGKEVALINCCAEAELVLIQWRGYNWKRQLQLRKTFAEACNTMGRFHIAQGQCEKAFHCYEGALSLWPTLPEARNNKGLFLAGQGKHEQAIWEFRFALEEKRTFAAAHNNMGLSYLALGNYAAAIKSFKRALQLRPKNVEIQRNLLRACAAVASAASSAAGTATD